MGKRFNEKNNNQNITRGERNEIIKIYALRIEILYERHKKILQEIESLKTQKEISSGDRKDLITMELEYFDELIAKILLEQYFNTTYDTLFDLALEHDEKVKLEPVSYINMNEIESFQGKDLHQHFVLFHKGFFFDLPSIEKGKKDHGDYKAIIRDPDSVAAVNKKVARAQRILMIDEATIGIKEYQGLCERSHFRYFQ